jgi:hypothetical protein
MALDEDEVNVGRSVRLDISDDLLTVDLIVDETLSGLHGHQCNVHGDVRSPTRSRIVSNGFDLDVVHVQIIPNNHQ